MEDGPIGRLPEKDEKEDPRPGVLNYFGIARRSSEFCLTSHSDSEAPIPMDSLFFPELMSELTVDSDEHERQQKHYYTQEQRDKLKSSAMMVFIGQPTTLFKMALSYQKEPRWMVSGFTVYPAVMAMKKLFAWQSPSIHHSWVMAGMTVSGAGKGFFHQGRLVCVNNDSGHYKPKHPRMKGAFTWFYHKSKNPKLIFEDHSQQDKRLPFNGICFYDRKLFIGKKFEFYPIKLQCLVDHLEASMGYFVDRVAKKMSTLSVSDPGPELLRGNVDEDDPSYVTIIEASPPPPSSAILDIAGNWFVGEFTSLRDILSEDPANHSRFNGVAIRRKTI